MPGLWDKYDRAWCDEHKCFPSVMYLGPDEDSHHWWTVQRAIASWQERDTPKIGLLGRDHYHEHGQVVELAQLMRESPSLVPLIETIFPREGNHSGVDIRQKGRGEILVLNTVGPRQLQKISAFLYTHDYAVTEADVRSVQCASGPTCQTCMNYLRLLNFHLDVFQAAGEVGMPGLQLVAMGKFLRVMESASERVLLTITREVYRRRWPTDEMHPERYQLQHPNLGLVSSDYRADLIVPACTRFLLQLQIRRDMVLAAGRWPPPETEQVEARMDLLRKTLPWFDRHMKFWEARIRV
ncbi:hypothetical protein N7492_000054 [Penicillium capsulatum]|uniref:Uncharacterized protein n=1 Tax=Penicillium capsulatum TaxID=69766 RepID=A0A9W9LYB9_9EURO|nr:hypothetical protein N7492_000054 [Penicillium capsulatum]KAJ6130874.1 hypothetical protein N7512_003654 [Penicillium capsulatum]